MRFVASTLFALIVASCAFNAAGPIFHEEPLAAHSGKAIVYFYRNSDLLFTDYLSVNEKTPLPVYNKGYYVFIFEPGVYEFTVSLRAWKKAKGKFDFRENETYYIRYRADSQFINGFFGGYTRLEYSIKADSKAAAWDIITQCRLMQLPAEWMIKPLGQSESQ